MSEMEITSVSVQKSLIDAVYVQNLNICL